MVGLFPGIFILTRCITDTWNIFLHWLLSQCPPWYTWGSVLSPNIFNVLVVTDSCLWPSSIRYIVFRVYIFPFVWMIMGTHFLPPIICLSLHWCFYRASLAEHLSSAYLTFHSLLVLFVVNLGALMAPLGESHNLSLCEILHEPLYIRRSIYPLALISACL